MLLRTGALRGRLAFGALVAGRMARVTLLPFILAFLGAGRLAGPLLFLLRRRSRSSSSSGSPSLLSSSEDVDASSASTPLSSFPPRFRFVLLVGLAVGANFSGFFDTRPDLRRAADEAMSPASEGKTAALMLVARGHRLGRRNVEANERGAAIESDELAAGMVDGERRVPAPRHNKVWSVRASQEAHRCARHGRPTTIDNHTQLTS
jgi:hypothetical protein